MDNSLMTSNDSFDLDPVEVRVLGVLIEKSFLTPDNYPMSINAITNGCNQLTSREPVVNLSELEVQTAIDKLGDRKLVSRRDSSSARVAKYEHLIRLRFSLPEADQAVLALLMLRGPQTVGELRQRAERMHSFADASAVEVVVKHLEEKYPPMVMTLPRAAGTKEPRVAHLMGGPVPEEQLADIGRHTALARPSTSSSHEELAAEVACLREEVSALRKAFAEFKAQFE